MLNPIQIGNITISNPVFLAPMAGTSTLPFRKICYEHGAGLCTTELTSARSILYNGLSKSFRYMRIDPKAEGITSIQLFGSEKEDFTNAISQICNDELLGQVSIIDINMGCPVPKVVKTGAGCALMKNPKAAFDIAYASVKEASKYGKPVTIKTRIGYSQEKDNGVEFVKHLAQSGIAGLCVHGRYGTQMYHGVANVEVIASMRKSICDVKIPFIANGDITDGPSAKNMIEKTEADAISIGRAAAGNPWIFQEISSFLVGDSYTKPSSGDRIAMFWRELNEACSLQDETVAVKEMRGQMSSYLKGIVGSSKVRSALCTALTRDQVRAILEENYGKMPFDKP